MAKFLRTKIFSNYYESIKEINQFYNYYDLITNNHQALVGKIANIKTVDLSLFKVNSRFFYPIVEKTNHYDNPLQTIKEITDSYDIKQINTILDNFQKLNHIVDLKKNNLDQHIIHELSNIEMFIKSKLEQAKSTKKVNEHINPQLKPVQLDRFDKLNLTTISHKNTKLALNSYLFITTISIVGLLFIIVIILVGLGVL